MGLSPRIVPNPAREVFATLTEERKDYVLSIPKFGTGEAAFFSRTELPGELPPSAAGICQGVFGLVVFQKGPPSAGDLRCVIATRTGLLCWKASPSRRPITDLST